MADAHASEACGSNPVEVQVLSSAPSVSAQSALTDDKPFFVLIGKGAFRCKEMSDSYPLCMHKDVTVTLTSPLAEGDDL